MLVELEHETHSRYPAQHIVHHLESTKPQAQKKTTTQNQSQPDKLHTTNVYLHTALHFPHRSLHSRPGPACSQIPGSAVFSSPFQAPTSTHQTLSSFSTALSSSTFPILVVLIWVRQERGHRRGRRLGTWWGAYYARVGACGGGGSSGGSVVAVAVVLIRCPPGVSGVRIRV